MEICKSCDEEKEIRYPKLGWCKLCYQSDYNRRYYQKKKDKIKQQTKQYYKKNHDKCLADRKAYREKLHFDSKRQQVLSRDSYTCQTCNKKFYDEFQLTIHHKDRVGRGSSNPNNGIDNLTTLCRSCHVNEHRQEIEAAKRIKLKNQWSHRYLQCQECGTTERKHQGRGLCTNCYARDMHRRKKRMKIKSSPST